MSAAPQATLEAEGLERFATLDPDVVWPGSRHPSAGDAVCAALDKVREREHAVLDDVEQVHLHVVHARRVAADLRPVGDDVERVRVLRLEVGSATKAAVRALVKGERLGAGAALVAAGEPTATTGDVDENGDVVGEAPPQQPRLYDDAELDRQRAVAQALARRVGCNLSIGEAEVVVLALERFERHAGGTSRGRRARQVVERLRPRIERARGAARAQS